MNDMDRFKMLLKELIEKSGGNMSEASRRSGISVALMSRTLRGFESADIKSVTWKKLHDALGIKKDHQILKESRGEYIARDKYFKLAQFVKLLPPERQAPFFDLAKVYGFNLKEEHRQEDGDHVEKTA